MEPQLDRVPIAPLKEKYGQRKFYAEYIPVLGIEIQKIGKCSYISYEDSLLLEKYHQKRGEGEEAKKEFLRGIGRDPERVPERTTVYVGRDPVRSGTDSGMVTDLARIEILRLANEIQNLNPVGRWMASAQLLEIAASRQYVIIKNVLLLLLDKEKLPRKTSFWARGYKFSRVNPKSNEEWLAGFAHD